MKNMQDSAEEQVVVFKLGEQTYGLDILAVREIIRMEEITKIPNAQDFIEGIINLRGSIIPIIDLSKRFGIMTYESFADDVKDTDKRIIVVQVNGTVFGVMVDAVQEVLRVPANIIEPPPQVVTDSMAGMGMQVDAAYLNGIAKFEERLIILLNHNKILYDYETEELQQVVGQ